MFYYNNYDNDERYTSQNWNNANKRPTEGGSKKTINTKVNKGYKSTRKSKSTIKSKIQTTSTFN